MSTAVKVALRLLSSSSAGVRRSMTGRLTSPVLSDTWRAGAVLASLPRRWLPVCTVDTNLPQEAIASDFLSGLSKLIATTLNKPEKLISLALRTNVQVMRDGHTSPSAVVHIWSIGVFDNERNPGYSVTFLDYLSSKLDMPVDRITLFLHPVNKVDAAHLLYAEQKETGSK